VDYKNKEVTIYEQMSSALVKFLGGQRKNLDSTVRQKKEDAFYMSGGYRGRGGRGNSFQSRGGNYNSNQSRGNSYNSHGRGSYYSSQGRGANYSSQNRGSLSPQFSRGASGSGAGNGPGQQSRLNRTDAQGKITRCINCDSKFHYVYNCPNRDFQGNQKVYETTHSDENYMDKEDALVAATIPTKSEEMITLVAETLNCAVLDSACSSTVCGQGWMTCYLDSLDDNSKRRVREFPGTTTFRFGNDATLKSLKKLEIPCMIAGKNKMISTDVVSSDIPLLLGKPTMKRMDLKLDMKTDDAEIFGETVHLQCTPSGHYFIPLLKPNVNCVQNIHQVLHVIDDKSEEDKLKTAIKLHRQFAHPSANRLKSLLKDASVNDKAFLALIDEVSANCDLCKRYKRTPSRPVVSMPLARDFNDTVAMDLKVWDKERNVYFLHLIDLATRFSIATIINKKESEVIIDKVMQCWIGTGLGIPSKFLCDNGGEFANEKFKDMCENLNITVLHTAAESPFSNGICERNHAVVDEMVRKIISDNPQYKLSTALAWAVHAKNCMHIVGAIAHINWYMAEIQIYLLF
ncbi:unnamed protein product, partial [Meganyctiphanes norvegica]